MKRLPAILTAAWLLAPLPAQAWDKSAVAAWNACTSDASDALALQSEPIDIIVSAVFGSCSTEETYLVLSNPVPGYPAMAQEIVNEAKRSWARDVIIARVLANRAARRSVTPSEARKATQPRYLQQ